MPLLKLSNIAVIGAGVMGSGIAQKIAQSGMSVTLINRSRAGMASGFSRIREMLAEAVERGIFSPEQTGRILSRITGSLDLGDAADADLVIETVDEDRRIKVDVFRKLDTLCGAKTLLATNTSTFKVGDLAAVTGRPDRCIGLHYFHPAVKNRLVEVVAHAGTSRETLSAVLEFSHRHGKSPILVKDSPGFAVNRFFVPFLNEAARMLAEKVANIPTIEAAAKSTFGIDRGAFELMNANGIALAVHATGSLGRTLGGFYDTCPVIRRQAEMGALWDLAGTVADAKVSCVSQRFLGVCLGVATTLVAEDIASPADTDLAAKLALRWKKGPFEIMREMGMAESRRVVRAVFAKYPDFPIPRDFGP